MRSAVSLSIATSPQHTSADPPEKIRTVNAPVLRPLGVGEILDVGIKIYFQNAWTLFRIVLFVVLPTQILVNVIQVSALPSGVHASYTFEPTPRFTSDRTSLSGRETATLITGYVIAIVLNALAGKLAQAACFRAVTDAYLGEGTTWRASLRFALRRLPAVVVASILSTIFIGLGTLACIVPGIYLWGAFYVAVPALLVEGIGPMRALGRSRELVRGRWWGTFGVALLGSLLVLIVGGALSGLVLGLAFASPAQDTVAGFVLNVAATTISSTLTTPAVAAFAIVLYIDLRVRKEGFDLYLLAQRLGVEPGEAPKASFLPPPRPAYDEGEKPPYWPPPPGWKPSGAGTLPPVATPELQPEPPPYWPPPPGWKPDGDKT
jgi:hypothetical protein